MEIIRRKKHAKKNKDGRPEKKSSSGKTDLKGAFGRLLIKHGNALAGGKSGAESGDSAAASAQTPEDFNVSVRSSVPILSIPDDEKGSSWKKELFSNVAGGLLLLSVFALFCMIIDDPFVILFAIPALLFYTVLTTLDSLDMSKAKYIACGVIAVLLIGSAIIWHTEIGGGLALLTDEFYDICEESQAYIYDRFPGGDEAMDSDAWLGMAWISSLIGMLASLIPSYYRRGAGMLFAGIIMLALAYYGLVPVWISMCAFIVALLLTMPRGSIVSALPLILGVVLVFGLIVLIDPGENYSISRADENIRDRIAFHSALIERDEDDMETEDTFTDLEDQDEDESPSVINEDNSVFFTIGIIVLVIAAIGALVYLFIRKLRARQRLIRKGLDSDDNRVAVTAMFPYSIRWLKAEGLVTGVAPFSELTEEIRSRYSDGYAENYGKMYLLWREAAYSDHEISNADRLTMDGFMKKTMEMASEKWNPLQKLRMKIKYAL